MERIAFGDSASQRAVTRVNAEQASKRTMRKPTRLNDGEGRRRGGHVSLPSAGGTSDLNPRFRRGNGDGTLARNPTQHGKPQRWRRVTANETPARDRLGRLG